MERSKKGGPAFPVINTTPGFQHTSEAKGMTLRDWFAGQVIGNTAIAPPLNSYAESLAQSAYELADAMLAERSKANPQAESEQQPFRGDGVDTVCENTSAPIGGNVSEAVETPHSASEVVSGDQGRDLLRKGPDGAESGALGPYEADQAFLIWSNEHGAWWGPGECGYFLEVERAGAYTRDRARQIAQNARGGWRPGIAPPEIVVRVADLPDAERSALSDRGIF